MSEQTEQKDRSVNPALNPALALVLQFAVTEITRQVPTLALKLVRTIVQKGNVTDAEWDALESENRQKNYDWFLKVAREEAAAAAARLQPLTTS